MRLCRNPCLSLRTHDSACGNLYIIKDLWDCFGRFTPSQRHCDTVSNAWACLGRRRLPQRICRERFETVPYMSPPYRLNIIFDLEME